MDVIGQKRAIILGILLVVNLVFLSAASMVFEPQKEKNQRSLRRAKSDITRFQRDLNSIFNEFDQLGGQQEVFNNLEKKQFFSPDLMSRQQLKVEELAQENGVKVVFNLTETRAIPLKDLSRVEGTLIRGAASLEISALDDVDVYNFMTALKASMPGYIKLREFHIEREIDYSGNVLREIMQGKFPTIVRARYLYYWYFVKLPEDKTQQGEGS